MRRERRDGGSALSHIILISSTSGVCGGWESPNLYFAELLWNIMKIHFFFFNDLLLDGLSGSGSNLQVRFPGHSEDHFILDVATA